MQIKIKRINNGKLPTYESDGAAGADCYARIKNDIVIKPGTSETIPLGFAVEIPVGYEMQIRGRSGLARKNNIDEFVGTIDSDYRGEVCAILINKGTDYFTVRPFDRIAQAVIAPVIKANWNEVEELSETKRGEGGFGSTGVSEIKVAYPHKVEKFYEPFNKIFDIKSLIGKDVIIDGKIRGKVESCYYSNGYPIVQFYVIRDNLLSADSLKLNFVSAFERVTIDGHRFGKEMQFETEEN